jgi:hypothetical protein|tara:strand:- start:137 stop:877 length:741 start_codon:yes stop_codon:yes gene_type:complete
MSEEPKKRGRKRTSNLYFGPDQEKAVVDFLTTESYSERNKIYNEYLRHPINKMIDSIIRRYKLYRKDYTFEDMHADTLSFLVTKMHNFKPAKNKKAYSYFGTICKHYLLGQLIKDDKKLRTDLRYDDVYKTVETMDDFIYNNIEDKDKTPLDIFIGEISASIKLELETTKLNENEIKVGNSLVTVLDSWETIFEQIESGNKYNKNLILSYIREMTDLSTKDIRVSMKKFKKIYILLKNDKIDNGLI